MNSTRYQVPVGHKITVAVVDGSAHIRQDQDSSVASLVTNANTVSFGPYFLPRSFVVQESGNATVTVAESDIVANVPSTAQKAVLDGIPVTDQQDSVSVWNDEGVLKVSGT